MSGIEWGVFPNNSAMSMVVHDNTANLPTTVLDAGAPFDVHVSWTVPAPMNATIGGNFRLRAYAESIGPGTETQVGATVVVPAVPGQEFYDIHIPVPAGALLGEGVGAPPVSGAYRMLSVLQHLNPGPTKVSGYAEGDTIFLRTP